VVRDPDNDSSFFDELSKHVSVSPAILQRRKYSLRTDQWTCELDSGSRLVALDQHHDRVDDPKRLRIDRRRDTNNACVPPSYDRDTIVIRALYD
jgi:hypothetical protein